MTANARMPSSAGICARKLDPEAVAALVPEASRVAGLCDGVAIDHPVPARANCSVTCDGTGSQCECVAAVLNAISEESIGW